MEDNTIQLYPSSDGFIGKLITSDVVEYAKANVETIVILDRSGSMGDQVTRIFSKILPAVFQKLKYDQNDIIKVLLFDDKLQVIESTINDLKNHSVVCGGCTYMTPAIKKLELILSEGKQKKIRLLTLSDGELYDQVEALNEASRISKLYKNNHIINSQTVRFFTSSMQPDTRGLSGMLQLNTMTTAKLIDIKYELNDVDITDMISNLFMNDGLNSTVVLTTTEKIMTYAPWMAPTDSLNLASNNNIVWFTKNPTDIITLNGKPLKIVLCDPVSMNNYGTILETKISYYLNQLRILKVINTPESQKEILDITKYFSDLEKFFEQKDSIDLFKISKDTGLRARVELLKKTVFKRKKSVFAQMAQIANDEKVAKLNAAQQADYLREIDVSKNAKGLARRALTHGLDFDTVIKKEIKDMRIHLDELTGIDDSEHLVSFYSQSTTLEGIKTLCSIDEVLFDEIKTEEVIKIINIVGVACDALVGDYPDPMTYRVNKIYHGCYVSVSDLLTAHTVGDGKGLRAVGSDKDIVNVIPMFDDNKIHLFLKKYAPTILEYSASVGMRRVLCHIPMTHSYTTCAGVWKMIEDLNKNKSEIIIKTFTQLLNSYKIAIGSYFDHLLPFLTKGEQKINMISQLGIVNSNDAIESYYISNNGITNMINPICSLVEKKETKYISNILRAIYSYELWQACKKLFKTADGVFPAEKVLHELLGIDLEKYKTPMAELYEIDKCPIMHDKYYLNNELLDKIINYSYYIDYITLLPQFLTNDIKEIPQMDEKTICVALDIKCDLRTFKFYNIIIGLIYNTKKVRVNTEKEQMNFIDPVDIKAAENLIKEYTSKQYHDKYISDLAIKTKHEREQLVLELVDKMIESKTVDDMINLFKTGLQRNTIRADIVNASSIGYLPLKTKLLDTKLDVPDRAEKIRVLLLGCDRKDNKVWNGGNIIMINLGDVETVFTKIKAHELFVELKDAYRERNRHVYRDSDKPNRHGHCDSKPSYFGLGYMTLEQMVLNISDDEWKEYKEIHHNCCGIGKH
jgi:hypothetical protein